MVFSFSGFEELSVKIVAVSLAKIVVADSLVRPGVWINWSVT
jgi:hypothetical protein